MATPYRLTPAIRHAHKKIRHIIARSQVPEDPLHAEDTLRLLLRIYPHADVGLRLAAIGHDIERAFPKGIKVERKHFDSYDEFKRRHAENSARILGGLLLKCRVDEGLIERVKQLVLHHETGGFEDADILKDADSLSFFHTNLRHFMKREPYNRVLDRAVWGFKRLSPQGIGYLNALATKDVLLAKVLRDAGIRLG